MSNVIVSLELTTITCCRAGCGIVFAVPQWWNSKRREDHTTWCCPNGHEQHFNAKTDAEIANQRLEAERAAHDQTKAELRETERRRRAEKAAKTKVLKRVANGVCPSCKRHFSDLQRHMATKHPTIACEN